MDYQKDIEQEAKSFLSEHEEEFKQAIKENKEFDRNEIDDLDEWFHEEITDRAYTLKDAAYIISNCENEETDSGIWEGQDAKATLSSIAAYSFSNDVWLKCEEIYKEIKENFDTEKLEEKEEENEANETIDIDTENDKILDRVFKEVTETKLSEVEKGSDDEARLIERYLT